MIIGMKTKIPRSQQSKKESWNQTTPNLTSIQINMGETPDWKKHKLARDSDLLMNNTHAPTAEANVTCKQAVTWISQQVNGCAKADRKLPCLTTTKTMLRKNHPKFTTTVRLSPHIEPATCL
jgi:hypothetical protein